MDQKQTVKFTNKKDMLQIYAIQDRPHVVVISCPRVPYKETSKLKNLQALLHALRDAKLWNASKPMLSRAPHGNIFKCADEEHVNLVTHEATRVLMHVASASDFPDIIKREKGGMM